MSATAAPPRSDSQVISAGMVKIYKDMLGRGPTKVRTSIQDDMVVTVLAESLTKAEETLNGVDHAEAVRDIRRTLQDAMAGGMKSLVEVTLNREVICVLSDHSPDPDYAVEVLLLAPLVEPTR